MKFLDVLKLVLPIIVGSIKGGDKYGPLIAAGIAVAEATQKPGKDKKEIALASVKAGAETANLIAGHTVVDSTKAVAVADGTIDQIVSLVNHNLDLAENVKVEKTAPEAPASFDNLLKK